jgi:hypothetical protein
MSARLNWGITSSSARKHGYIIKPVARAARTATGKPEQKRISKTVNPSTLGIGYLDINHGVYVVG